jgi:hypothetical protein
MILISHRATDTVLGTKIPHENGDDQGVGFVAGHLHKSSSANVAWLFVLQVPEVLHFE